MRVRREVRRKVRQPVSHQSGKRAGDPGLGVSAGTEPDPWATESEGVGHGRVERRRSPWKGYSFLNVLTYPPGTVAPSFTWLRVACTVVANGTRHLAVAVVTRSETDGIMYEFRAVIFLAEDHDRRYGHEMAGVIRAESFDSAYNHLKTLTFTGEHVVVSMLVEVAENDPTIVGARIISAY